MANTYSVDLESGSSQYLSITDASQTGLDVTGNLTIEHWIKFESIDTSGNNAFANKWGTGSQFGYYFRFGGDTNELRLAISSTGSNTTDAGVSWIPSISTWYHVAAVYTASSGSVSFYVNGVQQGTTQTGLATSIFNNNQPFVIGVNYNGGSTTQFFDGKLDDVRVWNTARTSTQISDNYQKELVGNESGLVGYWKLNNSLLDETSNNNDLTNNNSATFSTDVPFTGVTTNSNFFQLF